MNELLREIGDFVIGSIPTMIIFLLLLPCYTLLVHGPIRRVLAERRERTAGAVEKAHAAMAMAEAKAQEYEARLRAARVEQQKARDKQVALWNVARDKAIEQARELAQAQTRAARIALAADADVARAQMEQPGAAIDSLASEILDRVTGRRRAGVNAEGVGA
jgi:F-type H+-transporting ATPase subunit b